MSFDTNWEEKVYKKNKQINNYPFDWVVSSVSKYISKNKKNYVKSVGEQGSGILSSMNNANCLIYLPVEKGKSNINDNVKIVKFKNYI